MTEEIAKKLANIKLTEYLERIAEECKNGVITIERGFQ